MLDINVRLKNVQVACTCTSPSKLFIEHDQLCQHRIVLEAEAEIRILRAQVRMLDSVVQTYPGII
jgi:hypothetical protein